jgi:hypothetical protein
MKSDESPEGYIRVPDLVVVRPMFAYVLRVGEQVNVASLGNCL